MKTMPACTIWTSTEPTTRRRPADAAEQAGAAEHGGGDDVELLADAEVWLSRPIRAISDDAAERRADAADDVDRERDAVDGDAGLARRLGVVADGVDLTAELVRVSTTWASEHDAAAKTTIGIGTAEEARWPKARIGAGTRMPNWSVIAVPRPRPATSVASVTRNGEMRSTDDAEGVDRAEAARRRATATTSAAGDAAAPRSRMREAGGQRREVHVRADREVDAGGEQHEGHADGDDAGEGSPA